MYVEDIAYRAQSMIEHAQSQSPDFFTYDPQIDAGMYVRGEINEPLTYESDDDMFMRECLEDADEILGEMYTGDVYPGTGIDPLRYAKATVRDAWEGKTYIKHVRLERAPSFLCVDVLFLEHEDDIEGRKLVIVYENEELIRARYYDNGNPRCSTDFPEQAVLDHYLDMVKHIDG